MLKSKYICFCIGFGVSFCVLKRKHFHHFWLGDDGSAQCLLDSSKRIWQGDFCLFNESALQRCNFSFPLYFKSTTRFFLQFEFRFYSNATFYLMLRLTSSFSRYFFSSSLQFDFFLLFSRNVSSSICGLHFQTILYFFLAIGWRTRSEKINVL